MPNYAQLPNNQRGQRGHILVVEQNPSTSRATCEALKEDRFLTTVLRNGRNNGGNFTEYDLVLLEQRRNGSEACLRILKKLRQVSPVPIVVLSEETNSAARISALESGADDYLCRPYLTRELVARVKAVLRRSRLGLGCAEDRIQIDLRAKQVSVRGRSVDLTAREFEILSILAERPRRNFSRNQILEKVWGTDYTGDPRRVDLYVSRIRAKMHVPGEEDVIRSIYGVGYRFEPA